MQGGSGMTMTSLIDLDVEMALGDEPISVQELEQLAELKVPLVRFRGQWIETQRRGDPGRQPISGATASRSACGKSCRSGWAPTSGPRMITSPWSAEDWLNEVLENLQQKGRIELMDAPEGFDGQLRPYQQMGYSWLAFLSNWGLGSLPGRRHGPGQDRPDPGRPGAGPPAGQRPAQPAGLPNLCDQQLAARGWQIHSGPGSPAAPRPEPPGRSCLSQSGRRLPFGRHQLRHNEPRPATAGLRSLAGGHPG